LNPKKGKTAGKARKDIEQKIGKKVVSSSNSKQLQGASLKRLK